MGDQTHVLALSALSRDSCCIVEVLHLLSSWEIMFKGKGKGSHAPAGA